MVRAPHGHGGGKLLELKREESLPGVGQEEKTRAKSEREKGGQPVRSKELLARLGTHKWYHRKKRTNN